MPRPSELRERAVQALERAREIERREEESEEPLSEEDRQAHAQAVQEADDLNAQADEIEGRAAATVEAERRLRESERRSATPPRRRSRPPMDEDDDGGQPPRERSRREGDDNPPLEGYSIVRAMRGRFRQLTGEGRFDGLEREWHDHLRSRRSEPPEGVLIPWDAPLPRSLAFGVRRRDLTTVTGAGAIPNDLVPTFLDLLRARLVLADLGVRVLTASGKFWYPKKTAGTTGYWVGEGVPLTESDITIGQVPFDPKTVGAHTVLSRKFLLQNEVGGDDMAIDDIATTIAQTIEKAGINGSGSSAQPTGVLQNSNVPTVAIAANGGALTYAKLVELANRPNLSNAPKENQAFVFNPDTSFRLESTPMVAGQTAMLYTYGDTDRSIGRRAVTTTNVPTNLTKGSGTNLTAAVFGAWNQMAIVLFSGLDLIVNPYSEDKEGNVRITMFQDVDVNLLYPEAFAKIVDVTTTGWPV